MSMSDKELIDYCEMQSMTPVGMIHKGMIKRLLELGNLDDTAWVEGREWWSLDAYVVKELCEVARLNMAGKSAA